MCADESDGGLRDSSDGTRSTIREQGLPQTVAQYEYSYEHSADDPQASLTNNRHDREASNTKYVLHNSGTISCLSRTEHKEYISLV
jgi:hypothetical protein